MTENEIQREIMESLDKRGFLVWRHSSLMLGKNKFMPRGMPDIFFLCGGLLVGIEVKTLEGKLSAEQRKWGDRLVLAGGHYCVATCINDVDLYMRTMSEPTL